MYRPYDAGVGTDTVERALADAAKGSFKNISVENRSGGGGATGMLAGAMPRQTELPLP